VQVADLEPHLHAQRGVEIGERLVEQERLRLAHDRAADRDALALAAGELARLAIEVIGQVQRRGRLARPSGRSRRAAAWPSSARRRCCRARSCADRARRTGTPSPARAAPGRRWSRPCRRSDLAARGDVLEPGDQAQQRRLAAARRADEHRELAVLDLEIDAVDDLDGAERLADVFSWMLPMGRMPLIDYLTAPKVRPRTSCFCENQPRMRIGAIASVEAAESLAQNSPSGAE
jgi:hypothetical protein